MRFKVTSSAQDSEADLMKLTTEELLLLRLKKQMKADGWSEVIINKVSVRDLFITDEGPHRQFRYWTAVLNLNVDIVPPTEV